ncbi:MAG: hypothetical protein WCA97_14745 [Terriglobales bacterium]
MATTWKSDEQKATRQNSSNTSFETGTGRVLSSWSRQQKLTTGAGLATLGLLLAAIACSKQSPKPALVGVSSPAANLAMATAQASIPTNAANPAVAESSGLVKAPAKKTTKHRPADVTYSDANYGVSFLYPRKAELISGDKMQRELIAVGDVPMNFTQPGGVAVASVALPGSSYAGTDFASASFNVNVNRGLSEQECSHFAFVDTRDGDGEPVDAEKVKVGSTDMEVTSTFTASAMKQAETKYYHNYENGTCYEYVLGLGTEGFATEGGIEPVNRDEVFAKLEKILATVTVTAKTSAGESGPVAEPAATGIGSGKE